jgi:hypothetical protein
VSLLATGCWLPGSCCSLLALLLPAKRLLVLLALSQSLSLNCCLTRVAGNALHASFLCRLLGVCFSFSFVAVVCALLAVCFRVRFVFELRLSLRAARCSLQHVAALLSVSQSLTCIAGTALHALPCVAFELFAARSSCFGIALELARCSLFGCNPRH